MPRFTRILFCWSPSPFLLGGVIEQQLKSWRSTCPESVREIQKSLYMDNLITGTTTAAKARELKVAATAIFANTTFELHKWHSNVPALESAETEAGTGDQSFAKQQLGVPRGGDCSLLGLRWNKQRDAISVAMPTEKGETTKRDFGQNCEDFRPLGAGLAPHTWQQAVISRCLQPESHVGCTTASGPCKMLEPMSESQL